MEGFRYGDTYGVVLVIPCYLFHDLAATIVLKDDEIVEQCEKSAWLETPCNMTCSSVRVEAASSSPVTVRQGLNHSRP